MRTTNSILKNTIYKILLEILKIIIPIITVPYVYRIFKPEIMGNIEFSQSIANYFAIFAGFGVYTYGLREISYIKNNQKERDKIFSELFFISTISSIIVSLIYYFYIEFYFTDLVLKKLLLINLVHLLSYIFYIEWINEAFENYKFISIKTSVIKIINFICIFLFIKKEVDFYKYLFLICFFVFFNNIVSFVYIKKYIKITLKKIEIKKYLIPLGTILLMSNASVLYTQLDKIFLGFYSKNLEEIAYYGIAQKLLSIVTILSTAATTVSIPRLSFYLGEGKKEEYEKLYDKLLSYMYLLLFPMGIGIMILSREIAVLFGGKEYIAAAPVIFMFGIRFIVGTVQGSISRQILFINRKENIVTYTFLICGIFNLIFKYILLKIGFLNASTAIFTTMIAEIIITILSYIYIKRYMNLKLNIFGMSNLKYLIFSLSFFVIYKIFRNLIGNNILFCMVIVLVCSFVYFSLLLFIKDKIVIESLENIKNKIKVRR